MNNVMIIENTEQAKRVWLYVGSRCLLFDTRND